MELKQGKYTIEAFAEQQKLTRQSALNLLSKLKKQSLAEVNGGGRRKRIYTIHVLPKKKTNGFYDLVNKYSPEKLHPEFEHYVNGRYTIEHAVIDGIKIGGTRALGAASYLFAHITNWKRLFNMAKKYKLEKEVMQLYTKARADIKCRRMPARYAK